MNSSIKEMVFYLPSTTEGKVHPLLWILEDTTFWRPTVNTETGEFILEQVFDILESTKTYYQKR